MLATSNLGSSQQTSTSQTLPIAESAKKKEILASLDEIHVMLDELRHRMETSSDIQDVIFIGKLIRELHTFVQMPLEKQQEVRQIPKQFEVAPGMGAEKVKPIRMATIKALGEITAHVEKLSSELGSLFHLVDLEQRIKDTQQFLQQARHK